MPLEVTRVTANEGFEIAKRLRYEVFIRGLGFDPKVDDDEYDFLDTTVHLVGRDVETNEYVAVIRCVVDPVKREGKVGRVGVLTKFQGKGYGGVLIEEVHRVIKSQCDTVLLAARPEKVGFYNRYGYARTSDETFLDDCGLDLCWMAKNLVDNE
ncbi:hypothetical protein Poli38472_005846 [Pythium oligandrum]|uniref:N-acetyltransferase domain-containing protein n=1 Tax=Pythium oligandrum TaxID=41045 RepID=A0A8K1CU93_PYTOL|nr:hypothetical protein Poli38472_005846 [Pythium oligandrum]|eukprot:TMW68378.1 hypothetical protein Poli38472_005846 [Pythium oligandrum]